MSEKLRIYVVSGAVFVMMSTTGTDPAVSRCNDDVTKLVATYPSFFQSKEWCDKARLIDDLVTGAGRFSIPSSNVLFHYTEFLTNTPPTVEDLITKVQSGTPVKTFIAVTHMGTNEIAVAYYETEEARNAAFDALVAAGWDGEPGGEIDINNQPPAPSIMLRGPGISNRIAPYLSPSAMVLAIGCYSSGLQSYFGSFSDPGDYSGNTFMGVASDISQNGGCDIIEDVIWGLGCFGFPVRGHELDDAMRYHYWQPLVAVAGNMKNSLHCFKSCWNWSATYCFVGVDPTTGDAVWGVENEDAASYYELRGYAYPGARAEVLEVVPGFGTDGSGHLRVYRAPLRGGYAEYDVVEYDDDRFISISPRFGPSDAIPPEFLAYEPGHDYDLEAIRLEPAKAVLPVCGGKGLASLRETLESHDPTPISLGQEELTGHVIVFAFHPRGVAPVCDHLEQYYPIAGGTPVEIVWFYTFGVPDPGVITTCVNLVRANNRAAGGYPENPDLQIVGDGGWATWPDEEDWSEQSLLCGYRPIYPQGAIGVLPTVDETELERYLAAAEDYINDQFVYEDAVFFVGDALNDTSAAWLREEVQHFRQAFPPGTNVSFLHESDFGNDYAGMRAAGYAAINEGAHWVFAQGIRFHVDLLTYFVSGLAWDPLQLTTTQRNVWVAFGCYAADTGVPRTHQCKRILFNQHHLAVGVGFFGPMMDGDGIHHRRARDVFVAEMAKATNEGAPITLAQLGQCFQNALVSAIPEYDWYADGWTYYGSIAIPYRDGPVSTAVRESGHRTPSGVALIAERNPSGKIFPLMARLSEAADVSLDVYNVAGRRVATVVRGHYPAGEHMWDWKPDDRLASGVYFAVLSARQERRTAKLVLVR